MKTAVFAYVLNFLPVWSLALATSRPPPHTSPLTPLAPRAECVDKRDQPDSFWSTVEGAASGSYEVQFILSSGTSVYAWCNLMALRRNQPQDGCAYWGLGVSSTLYSLFSAVKSVQGWTGTSTTSKRRDQEGEEEQLSFTDMMANAYADNGLSFDSIIPQIQGTNRFLLNSTTVGIVQKISILGVQIPGEGGDILHDHSITVLSDGTGYLASQPILRGSNTTGSLERRHDGPGLKYNWKIFDYATNVLGSPDMSAAQPVAQHMAQDYVSRANADQTMSEYVATVAFDGAYSMGIRIIPETDGFGENYEDVNFCGDLTGRAHDELR